MGNISDILHSKGYHKQWHLPQMAKDKDGSVI